MTAVSQPSICVLIVDDHTVVREGLRTLIGVKPNVKVIGEAADGVHAQLRVVDVPDGVAWEIVDYDGNEQGAATHRTWG